MQSALTRSRIFVFSDLLLQLVAFYALWMLGSLPSSIGELLPILALASGPILLTALVMGLYRPNAVTEPRFQVRCAVVVVVVTCSLVVGTTVDLFAGQAMPKEHFLLAVALCLIGMMVLRVAVHHMSLRPQAERRVLAVLPPSGLKLLNDLSEPVRANISQAQFDTDAEGRVAPDARQALREALRQEQFAEVVLSDALTLDAELALDLASRQRHGLRVRSLSRYLAEETGRLPHDDPETLRNLLIRARPRSGAALLPKRVMDLTLSLVLLILLMPVIVIAVILVRLEDGGPVLYRQTRVGLNQKPFTLLKFRSMRVDAEANGVARWADRRDSRVTRFGAFMRLSRIDELPQLLNVLRGDMSLVGPRPERPEMIAKLKEHIPSYDFRHLVPPGLTGWAQINYPYGASIEDAIQKTNYDLYYVANRSCIRDGLILMETIRVVLFAEGSR